MASWFTFSVLTCESECVSIVRLARCNWICEDILYNFSCNNVRKEAQSSGLGTKRWNFFFEPGLLHEEKMAIEAFQVCCLLLPPENRRKLQLLLRLMARVCLNKEKPPLCDGFGTRSLVGWLVPSTVTCFQSERQPNPCSEQSVESGREACLRAQPSVHPNFLCFQPRTLKNMVQSEVGVGNRHSLQRQLLCPCLHCINYYLLSTQRQWKWAGSIGNPFSCSSTGDIEESLLL